MTDNPERPRRWRDVLPIHPAAELFPLMTPEELRELAADIAKNGLRERVTFYDDPRLGVCLLDGRNRLDALALLGDAFSLEGPHCLIGKDRCQPFDPYAFVISKNLHRRHLTPAQRRNVIAKLLALNPAKSNRAIAASAGVSHVTVAAVRNDLVATGQIDQLGRTTGRDGKARPARRTVHRPTIVEVINPRAPDEIVTVTMVEPTLAATIDIDDLRTAWSAVALQAVAGNKPLLRDALGTLISAASTVLKTLDGLQ